MSKRVSGGFPIEKRVTLRYSAEQTLSAGATIQDHLYRLGSVYDPDYTGTGAQPMLFDQWAAIYSRYTVLSTHVTINPTYSTGGTITPSFLGLTISTSSTSVASEFKSVAALLESPYTVGYIQYGNANMSLPIQRGRNPAVKASWNAATFFGVDSVRDGSIYSAAVNDNPSTEAYIHVFAAPIAANTFGQVNFIATILYDVVFRDPKLVDGS
jgi:hypothetical protein